MPPRSWANDDFCYVTTTGRRTGKPHQIEIWFAYQDAALYLLAGGGRSSDWVKNALADPVVSVRVGGETYEARARMIDDPNEDATARRLLAGKYQNWREGLPLSSWAETALAVALELGT